MTLKEGDTIIDPSGRWRVARTWKPGSRRLWLLELVSEPTRFLVLRYTELRRMFGGE